MVVRYEIGTYSLLLLSGYTGVANLVGYIYFSDKTGKYIGLAGIIRDASPLPANAQYSNGLLAIYFHEAELVSLLDTLRNEKPIFVQFHTDLKWGSIGTDLEPVGEQEAPRAA
jgi:hypothetical protein